MGSITKALGSTSPGKRSRGSGAGRNRRTGPREGKEVKSAGRGDQWVGQGVSDCLAGGWVLGGWWHHSSRSKDIRQSRLGGMSNAGVDLLLGRVAFEVFPHGKTHWHLNLCLCIGGKDFG